MNREHIQPGDHVVYQPHPNATPEHGVVTRLATAGVFVRYGTDYHAKLTPTALLQPATSPRGDA